jgi:Icc-related predicted phosphoesterase
MSRALCGHDHDSPLENGTWHALLAKTTFVNAGQSETAFHYAILDFELAAPVPSPPSKIMVWAFPRQQEIAP